STSDELKKLGYKTQVNAREINLFYLSEGNRQRIVKANGKWNVVDGAKQWTEDSLLAELEAAPERFSPNVLMRPAYQEFVLPNIAYVGGPGEIAYWLQLKQNFDRLGVPYPMLVLRDSAMLISTRTQEKLKKLGLEATDIFNEKHLLQKQMLAGEDLSLATYKAKLSSIYSELKQHVSNTDKMLAAAADAEEAKALAGIDNIEKKMLKAAKAREEQKLNQLDKLTEELLPGGVMSERRDNYFQYRSEFGEGLTDVLLEAFDPLGAELKLVYQDLSLSK
ncbi:MAG: bacillithiol biosynthesis BshC, partial [Flavobacteriales bacterium]